MNTAELPLEIRAKLAELELELSEGMNPHIYSSYLYTEANFSFFCSAVFPYVGNPGIARL